MYSPENVQHIVTIPPSHSKFPLPLIVQFTCICVCYIFLQRPNSHNEVGWSAYKSPQCARVEVLESFRAANSLNRPTHGAGNLKEYGPHSHCICAMKSNHSWLTHKTKEGTMGGAAPAAHCKETDQTGSRLVIERRLKHSKASHRERGALLENKQRNLEIVRMSWLRVLKTWWQSYPH